MPTEAELRQRMHAQSGPPIDADAVVRLARRRRRPRSIAVGATATLAVLGLGVAGISGIFGAGGAMSASDSAAGGSEASAAPTEEYSVARSPASAPIVCGEALPAESASSGGLAIATSFPETVDEDVAAGSITLSNTGGTPIAGTTTAATFALVRDGVVVGYGDEPTLAGTSPVDLAPGETRRYQVVVTPVICPGDDAGTDALAPGDYQLSAVIDFSPDIVASSSGLAEGVRLTAPAEPISLR